MGMLDGLQGLLGASFDDPRTMATLQMAQGLLGGGGGMQRLAGGLQGYGGVMAQARQQEEEKRRRALQEQMLMQQLESAKAQQAERAAAQATQQKDDGLMRRLLGQPVESQMPQGMQGPGEPMQNRGIDPRTFINQGGSMGGLQGAMQLSQALMPQRSTTTVSKPGDVGRDENNKVLWQNAEKPEARPEALRALASVYGEASPEYAQAARQYAQKLTSHAPAATAISYGSPLPIQLPNDGGTGYIQPPTKPGGPTQILNLPGTNVPAVKPAGQEKEATEGERKAATLLQRLRGSEAQLSSALGESPGSAKPSASAEAARRLLGDTPANMLTSGSRQQVEAAQLDILDAALTLGTGAAYTREQLEGYRRSYFPQLGDGASTVADKQVRLKNVINAAQIAAGRAGAKVPKFDGSAAGGPAKISGDSDYRALPSGATYIAPDGTTRRKP